MKSILVTGGAGFIGSHLCKRLLDEGNNVICVDNLSTGDKRNLLPFWDNPLFEFVRQDVTFPFYVDGIDQIYHLACPASPVHYQRDPVQTTKTCVHGSINILGLAKRLNLAATKPIPILQASTSEVYGDPEQHPQTEVYVGSVNPIGPRACYDEGKRCAETLFFDYYRQYKIPIRVIRIFNTYGPNMCLDDGRVISNFIVQALTGQDITIHDAQTTRSFQYIDDLIEGMIRMMNNEKDFVGPINLGNPDEFTILELAEKIVEMTGSKSKIVHQGRREDDPRQRCADITLAKKELSWEPKVKLEEGLRKTIAYFEEKLKDAK